MKTCEIIVNFEPDSLDLIKSKFGQEDISYFTNDLVILNKGKEAGLDIEMLSTFFGFFTPDDDQINEISIERLKKLENMLSDGSLEGTSIVRGLRYVNLINLNNLEKIRRILQIKKNVIFLFHNFAFYYQSIGDIARVTGHKTKYNIATVSNLEIKSLDLSERWYRFDTIKKRLKFRSKEMRGDSFKSRLSKQKIIGKNYDVGFFLINNDTDFYLKPIYPILEIMNNKKLNSIAFTFDERTSNQMYGKKFHPTSLTSSFLQVVFPFSVSITEQLKYIFKEQEKKMAFLATNYYFTHLEKYPSVRKWVSRFKKQNIRFKKLKKIGKIFIFPIAILNLILQQIKKRYILSKWAALRFYVRHLEKYDLIRNIVTKPTIKAKLINDLTGIEEEIPFLDTYSIPSIEIKKVIKFVKKTKLLKSDDVVIESYLKYFHDNYVVNLLVKLQIVHAVIENIFNNNQFGALMIGADSPPFNNIVCNIANHKKIPTYSIPQVFIKFAKIAIMLPNASKILVSGNRVKEEFIKFGMDEKKIIVTGNPRYDYIRKELENLGSREESSKKMVLVAMSRWNEKDPEWMSQLIQFCNEKSLDVLIKIHPMYKFGSNKKFSEQLIEEIKQNCPDSKYLISYDIDLPKTIPNASVLITEYSIVAVEAAFNEIPVITVNFHRGKDNEYSIAYKNEGIAINSETIEELFDNINKIIFDKKTREIFKTTSKKFNFDFNYLHDGKASERIYDILTKSNKISLKNIS